MRTPEERRPGRLAAELARGEHLREAAEAPQLPDGAGRRDAGEPVPGGDGEGGQPDRLLWEHGGHPGFLRSHCCSKKQFFVKTMNGFLFVLLPPRWGNIDDT